MPQRGEIWLVDFGEQDGHEQGDRRPAAIVSDNRLNRSRAELAIVLPVTTTRRSLPSHVEMEPGHSGLEHTSYAKTEDVKLISTKRLIERLGVIPADRDCRQLHDARPLAGGTSAFGIRYRQSAILSTMGSEIGSALLKEARLRAGLSQSELGARAGVTQSVISAYESGHRQPALSTLAAMVEATGFELTVGLRRPPRRLRTLTGPLGRRVLRHRTKLVAVALAHGVSNLRVFGSVARGEDGPDSDVDLLADLPIGMGLFGLAAVRAELESVLRARVDLVPASDLKLDVRERIESELLAL